MFPNREEAVDKRRRYSSVAWWLGLRSEQHKVKSRVSVDTDETAGGRIEDTVTDRRQVCSLDCIKPVVSRPGANAAPEMTILLLVDINAVFI